jgi:hypothetical protein
MMGNLLANDESSPPATLSPHRGRLALIFGLVGLFCCGFIAGLPAWIIARGDLKQINQGKMDPSGKGLARAGLYLGIFSTIFWGLAMIWVLWSFGTAMYEQIQWRPQNSTRLAVEDIAYSRSGIALTVHAPSGVAEVWKQKQRGPFVPWQPHHYKVPFRITAGEKSNQMKVLVAYEFAPGGEWLLALKSADGYWESMSPNFPDKPTLSEAEWERLRAEARPGPAIKP